MTRPEKDPLTAARARLERANRKLRSVQSSYSGRAHGFDSYVESEARAKAEVADAEIELKNVQYAWQIADAECNALRAWLRGEVEQARNAYAACVPPAAPVLRASALAAVTAHADAIVAYAGASGEYQARLSAISQRVHAAIAAVYEGRNLLAKERHAAGLPVPLAIVPQPAEFGSPMPYDVPGSAAACTALIAALDAQAPAPYVGDLAFVRETAYESAEQIRADREETERRAELSDAQRRFESQWGTGTASDGIQNDLPDDVKQAFRDHRAGVP